MFIPFISDVSVRSDGGIAAGGPQSFDWDDNIRLTSSTLASSGSSTVNSPNVISTAGSMLASGIEPRDPKLQEIQDKPKDRLTPPSSPHVGSVNLSISGSAVGSAASPPISMSKDR